MGPQLRVFTGHRSLRPHHSRAWRLLMSDNMMCGRPTTAQDRMPSAAKPSWYCRGVGIGTRAGATER